MNFGNGSEACMTTVWLPMIRTGQQSSYPIDSENNHSERRIVEYNGINTTCAIKGYMQMQY